ncbi:polyhydroxyalkanoate granule-associated phasin [Aquabacterium sp. J223]|uniref:polyhydroxyalkanoate granule-associated phasin n=1 Tax=Aquabacterium sp. J223 TaxID=2898431 RepID=UPI0021AE2076|nr:polyhydroxyalkanoate granule-associated phasin [Aquabacterium sp. J223]UUX94874.1 hypothetical protein LRS07_16645 [Aquabacterium sp. J223]
MPTRRKNLSPALMTKSAELALAVPQVMAHRLTRMALAGPHPSARDQREFSRMCAEKAQAFGASWSAMGAQALQAQQQLAAGWLSSGLGGPRAMAAWSSTLAEQWQQAALGVLGQGLAPVHRAATANAKRLRRTKLR